MILDIFYFFFFLFYLPFFLLRGKCHPAFSQRLGFFTKEMKKELSLKRNIWVHAVSVGEVALVEGIMKGLKKENPECRIVLSVTTKTGHEFALKKYAKDGFCVVWSPLDFSWTVRLFVSVIKPKFYVAAETELWPNLFAALHARKIPIILVNGRISDAAYGRYRLAAFFLNSTLRRISLFCVQSDLDARRFLTLGAEKQRVFVVGNVKFDVPLPAIPLDAAGSKKAFGFKENEKVFVAASTHPGEEDVVGLAFCRLRSKFPHLRLAIVPRHPERAGEVAEILRKQGLSPVLWSGAKNSGLGMNDVLVVDAVGHLIDLYRAADVVFVGKSLGIHRRGGQNPIEPAALGKPVIVGSYMENFRDVMRLFLEAGAVIQISDGDELFGAVDDVLDHPQRMAGLVARAMAVVDRNRGATQRTISLLAGAG